MANNGEASGSHESESVGTKINIKVKTMDHQTHNMSIGNQMTVRDLKERIALLNGIRIEQQRLIYSGKLLEDDQRLSSYYIQDGVTLHLVCTLQSMSSFGSSPSRPGASRSLGVQPASAVRGISSYVHRQTDGISLNTQQEHPDSLQVLSSYLEWLRQQHSSDGGEVLGSAFTSSTSSVEGTPRAEQLARLLFSTRDMLINQTAQHMFELEGDLRHNLNATDMILRHRTQSNAQNTGRLFHNLGAYFLELARTMMQVQMGDSRSTAMVNAGPPFYITHLGPNPLAIQQAEVSTLASTTSRQINSNLVNDNGTNLQHRQVGTETIGEAGARSLQTLREATSLLPRLLHQTGRSSSVEYTTESLQIIMLSRRQLEQAIANTRQQNNTEVMDVHEEAATHGATADNTGATIANVTENIATDVSPGQSTGEFRSTAHESSIEPSNGNIGNSHQQEDVAQSSSQAKRQKME